MDHQNDEFEAFLRQFQLRKPGPVPEPISVPGRRNGRWLLATAAVVSTVLVAAVLMWSLATPDRAYATVEVAGDSLFQNGEKISAGRRIQSGASETMVIALEDETRVELSTKTELVLEPAADSVRILLDGGSIIVNAAPQEKGRLYVRTRDIVASVAGTVFLVHAERAGTRVAVIDGEVQVQHGPASKTLAAGAHMATVPSLELQSIASEIAWSRNADAHILLLQQSVPLPVTDNARQEPFRNGVTPVRVAPINVAPITIAPIAVTPIAPIEAPRRQQQQNPIPDGPIQQILDRSCSACHRSDFVWAQRFSNRQEIVELINREIGKGARISEPEYSMLVDYLSENFRRKKLK